MTNDFLGVGLKFPLTKDEQNKLALAKYEASISDAIWMILGTAKGERVMRPDFGCGIHDLVFSVVNSSTLHQLAAEVRQALLRWEPRIDLHAVAVTTDPTDASRLLIEIDYQVRSSNSRVNLVYPFYLE